MLQRNTSGYPLSLPSLIPPVQVDPGEDFEFPTLLAGFTPVDDLDTDTDEENESGKEDPPVESGPFDQKPVNTEGPDQ